MTARKVTIDALAISGKTDYITYSTPAAPLFDMRNPAGLFCFRSSDIRRTP